jgi:hypothetical protein
MVKWFFSIKLQLGRDHGIPGYVHYREICNSGPSSSFDDFANNMSPDVSDLFYNGSWKTLKIRSLESIISIQIFEINYQHLDSDSFFFTFFIDFQYQAILLQLQ